MPQNKILFVDACPRNGSRTRILANALVSTLVGDITHLRLSDECLPVIDETAVMKRATDKDAGTFDSRVYRFAKQFAQSDRIVIAAPYWDLSFPALLKAYLEAVSVNGITFGYTEEGIPFGMCRAQSLDYVTTSGGPIFDRSFGYGYVEALAKNLFGIPTTAFHSAENLDIRGNDAEAILAEAVRSIKESIQNE